MLLGIDTCPFMGSKVEGQDIMSIFIPFSTSSIILHLENTTENFEEYKQMK